MQGWVNDGGHAGYANQFAVDVLGLDPNYAPQLNDKDENASYAGWVAIRRFRSRSRT